jgi:hypothetical protein
VGNLLHRLRRDEEGQTLVLAAVFGLVLMLCVLGTVNLGRAVYDKVQLQTATDSAAYSQAAVEARALNFTAYTNRAMVVHYASIMAATSYLSWVHFLWAGMRPTLQLLQFVPYAGVVFKIILQVMQVLVRIMDWAVALLTPIVSAANMVLYALQEGAWWSVYGRLLQSMPPEAHSGDSTRHPYLPIWPSLIPAANATVFSQARGHLTVPQATIETAQILLNARNDAVQEARLHMLEVANSARQPWVAYGDRMNNPSISPFARHWRWKLWCAQIGSVARTELGGFQPTAGIGALTKVQAQVWAGERFQAAVKCPWPIGQRQIALFTFVAMDQIFNTVTPFKEHYAAVWKPKGFVENLIVTGLGIKAVLTAMQKAADQSPPNPDRRIFLLSPYVYFAPRAGWKAGLGPLGAPGNFAQPDVVIGLAKEGRDYNAEDGAKKYFGRKFSFNGKGAGTGSVDFSYTNSDWPKVAGLPALHKGLNAFSAAQVYYHRPGDWKEQPNFFNPLWGARLMPVLESNAAAKLAFGKVPGLSNFILH